MNSFYSLNKYFQWIIAILFIAAAFGLMSLYFLLCKLHFLFWFSMFIIILITQFLATPFFTLLGLYKYLSPMLLVVNPSKEKYDIHNGTSFDYLFVMRKTKPGTIWKKKMLLYYLDGLLEIIKRIESEEIPKTVIIRGSSYFFSDRTAQKFGFEIGKTGLFERFNLLVNYLDLFWAYSATKGNISFPNLSNIKTASTTGEILLANKEKLMTYRNRLS